MFTEFNLAVLAIFLVDIMASNFSTWKDSFTLLEIYKFSFLFSMSCTIGITTYTF